MARKWRRPAYVQRDFYQLWADFKELGRYFPALETLYWFENSLVSSEMDRGNIFERLLRSNLPDIWTPLVAMTRRWSRPAYAQVILTVLALFSGSLVIFPSPRDSKLIGEDFGFRWNGQKKNFWTLTYKQSGRNINWLSDYDQKVAETGLRAAWLKGPLGKLADHLNTLCLVTSLFISTIDDFIRILTTFPYCHSCLITAITTTLMPRFGPRSFIWITPVLSISCLIRQIRKSTLMSVHALCSTTKNSQNLLSEKSFHFWISTIKHRVYDPNKSARSI